MLTEGNVFYNVIFDNLRSHFYGILFSFLNFLILAESVTMFLLFDITPHSENVSKSILFFMAIVAGTSSLYLWALEFAHYLAHLFGPFMLSFICIF